MVVYLGFCHAETGTVFVAETAFVTYLDQRSTPRDTEWTHYPFYLDAFVVYETGDASLSSADIVGVETEC